MLPSALVLSSLLAASPPPDAVRVTATLSDPALVAGASSSVRLTIEVADGWSATTAGWPNPMLQVQTPAGVTLDGRVLTSLRELSRNGFLHAPYERMVSVGSSEITFTLTEAPTPGATIALNVLALIGDGTAGSETFVRRRVELPLVAGSTATTIDAATVSAWGPPEGPVEGPVLRLGDRAPTFVLPRADGSTLDLTEVLGKRPIIISTYRAHW